MVSATKCWASPPGATISLAPDSPESSPVTIVAPGAALWPPSPLPQLLRHQSPHMSPELYVWAQVVSLAAIAPVEAGRCLPALWRHDLPCGLLQAACRSRGLDDLPEVINYQQVGTVYILDGLFNMAELRVGAGAQAEVVRIYRGTPQAMRCPGDAACPVWSERVAGR